MTALGIATAVGRLAIASLFMLGGINKLLNLDATAALMAEAGLKPTGLLLALTIVLELGGGLAVAIGRRGTIVAGTALALFTLTTNVVFHDYWSATGREAELQLSLFFKNVAIAGALVFVAANSVLVSEDD